MTAIADRSDTAAPSLDGRAPAGGACGLLEEYAARLRAELRAIENELAALRGVPLRARGNAGYEDRGTAR